MPDVDTKTQQTTANAGTAPLPVLDMPGLDGLVDPLDKAADLAPADGKGASVGLANYTEALGTFLGPKLYGALAPHISEGALSKYANQAWNKAYDKVKGMVTGEITKAAGDKIAKEFENALDKEIEDAAGKWLKESGLASKITGFVDSNPYVVAVAAVAGAVGYVMSNPPMPAVNGNVKIGGGKLSAGVDLGGGILDVLKGKLSIEKLNAKFAWKGGEVKADWDRKTEDGVTTDNVSASGKVAVKDSYKNEKGKEVEFDKFAAKADGEVSAVDGDVKAYKAGVEAAAKLGNEGQHTITAGGTTSGKTDDDGNTATTSTGKVHYDHADGGFAHLDAKKTDGPDGSNTSVTATGGYKSDDLSATGTVSHTSGTDGTNTTGSVDFMKKSGDLTYTAGGSASTDGSWNANGGVTGKLNDNLSVSALYEGGRTNNGTGSFDTTHKATGSIMYKKNNFEAGFNAGLQSVNGKTQGTAGIGLKWKF